MNGKTELLKEFIQNDPYLAFLILFLHDLGLEPFLAKPIINRHTNTKFIAIDPKTIKLEQNGKSLELKIKEAKRLVNELYGPMPLHFY